MTAEIHTISATVLINLALHFCAGVAVAITTYTIARIVARAIMRWSDRVSLTASPSTAAGTPGANGAAILPRPAIRAPFLGSRP